MNTDKGKSENGKGKMENADCGLGGDWLRGERGTMIRRWRGGILLSCRQGYRWAGGSRLEALAHL